jgi:hypothetical protein
MARKAAIRFPDFTIVHRKDRNGYEGWFGGKAEAFRKTAAKVEAFFMKKYGQPGTVVENVRTYNLPVVEPLAKAPKAPKAAKAPKAPKPVVVATVTAKAPKVMEFEPETFEAEDRLDHSDLEVLL